MASLDRHRIGTFDTNGRFTKLLDLNPGDGTYAPVAGTFSVAPGAAETAIKAKNTRRYGGSKRVGEIHDNGALEVELYIQGTTADNSMVKLNALLTIAEDSRVNYFYEWRPSGTNYSVYYKIEGFSWEPIYRWVEFQGTKTLHVKLSMEIAPLGFGDPLDIFDDFLTDTLTAGDYTFDLGVGTLAAGGGQLVPTSATTKQLYHSARGYSYSDVQVTLRCVASTAINSGTVDVILKRISANTIIFARVTGSGGAQTVQLWVTENGSSTQLASAASGVSVGGAFWVRGRIEGNVVTGEFWTTEPTPSGTPNTTVSATITGARATLFGDGVAGQVGMAIGSTVTTSWAFSDFAVEPYTYSGRVLPERIDLKSVPGTAPARADVLVGAAAPTTQQVWALLGWAQKPNPFNMVWNGSFDDAALGTAGWYGANAGVYTFLGGSSTLTRVTSDSKFGAASMEVQTPATLNSGVGFYIWRKFKKGTTYTLDLWAKGLGGATTVMQYAIINVATGLGTGSTAVALTSAWGHVTLTLTPTVDMEQVALVVRTNTATATSFRLDGVQVYEGSTVPTVGRHAAGAGAAPAFGVLQAEAAVPSTLSNLAIVSTAAAAGGYDLGNSGFGAQTSYSAEWFIDPTMLTSDDFTQEVSFEVYARLALHPSASSAIGTISAIAENNSGASIYSEWGSTGKTLVLPITSQVFKFYRLGALTLPVNPSAAARWRLRLALTYGVAQSSADVDYLLLVPSRQRAAGPTGKPNDASYPAFFHSTGSEEIKIVRSDLSGLYRTPTSPYGRDSGLSGQQIELTPGDIQFVARTSNLVPEDPTQSATVEAGTAATSLHFSVWPRYLLTRSS